MTTETNTTERVQGTADYTAVKSLRSSPEAVLAALGTTDAISAWWGPTTGSAAEGGRFRSDFGRGDEPRYHDIVVTTFEQNRVVWTSAAAPHHHGEWDGTTMTFDLAPKGAGTELSFRHAGLTPRLECYGNCSAGWSQVLASLVEYVDTGKGTPYSDTAER
jgi:uncharacterized protein YndB with AHSA1/START domain